jgi:coatomer subunit alpha
MFAAERLQETSLLDPLAYLTAKTNGLDDVAADILRLAGKTEEDLAHLPPLEASTLAPPPVITSTQNLQWPVVTSEENYFDKALANGHAFDAGVNGDADVNGQTLDTWGAEAGEEGEEAGEDGEAEEGEGWDLDAEVAGAELDPSTADFSVPGGVDDASAAAAAPGLTEAEIWTRSSPFAGDHIAGGAFESAMQVSLLLLLSYLSLGTHGAGVPVAL